MPLVSVVMPSYNHENFIAKSIESVLGQGFDNLELIIVVDSSADDSRCIIQKIAEEDARVRIILHETNCEIAKTLNDGIAAVNGKFLALIASDDVWMKDELSKQLGVLESNADLIVGTEGEVIDDGGQPVGSSFSARVNGRVSRKKSGDIFLELVQDGGHIFGSTLL